jgi:hypothetical protein
VGFKLTITVFERAKTFHALEGAATMIQQKRDYAPKKIIEEHSK